MLLAAFGGKHHRLLRIAEDDRDNRGLPGDHREPGLSERLSHEGDVPPEPFHKAPALVLENGEGGVSGCSG